MKNNSKTMFISTMMLGILIVMSSSNWLSMWIGLEMNMISFLPLMLKKNNNKTSESSMMYFLVQSFSSILFISTIMISFSNNINFMKENMLIMTMVSMMMKMGMPPFHMWLPELMNKMEWKGCMMLMTLQKIPALIIINTMIEKMNINLFILMSTIIGAIGGINQSSIRKIMAYSSMNHLGWILGCMKFNSQMWMIYMIMYSMILIMLTNMMMKKKIFYINQMNTNMTTVEKFIMMMMFLSLGGMPPLIGFLMKWMVINSMTSNMFMLTIMIMMSLITLYYYMRMMNKILMMQQHKNSWNKMLNNYKMKWLLLMNFTLLLISIISFI